MTDTKSAPAPEAGWTDERLVQACIEGNERAWSVLIDKYKRLIYSIPIRYGLSPDNASEVFQQVCVTLISELPKLKDPKSLPAWLIRVTSHRCFHLTREGRRSKPLDDLEPRHTAAAEETDDLVFLLEREQLLREALAQVPVRCQELVHMLFFETPAVPYDQVAKNLRLARGSIGFIRMRCLKKLRLILIEKGFR